MKTPRLPRLRIPPSAAPLAGAVGGLGVIIGALLPWYAADLSEPFTPAAQTGWEATTIAKLVVVAGVVALLSAIVAGLGDRGTLILDENGSRAADLGLVTAGALAVGLGGFRTIRLPEPAEFLSRREGLYIVLLAGLLCVAAGLVRLLALDDPRDGR